MELTRKPNAIAPESRPSGRTRARGATLATAAVAIILLWQLIAVAGNYRQIAKDYETPLPRLGGSDFPAFYMGAELFLQDPARSYEQASQARTILEAKGYGGDLSQDSTWYRYYNPPAYSLLLAPLTLLDVRQAYLVTVAANVGALGVLIWLMGSVLRWRQPLTALALAGLLASEPLRYAFWHGQPNLLLAIILTGAFMLAERRRDGPSGALLALAAIKPQWLLLPAMSLIRLRPRAALTFAAVIAVVLLPFALLGVHGTLDWVRLVRSRGDGDVHDDGFAEAILSWSGFFRAYSGAVRPEAWLAFSILTALAYLPIWISRRSDLLPPAAVLTTLLVGPHSHPQDWLLVAPAACFVLRDQAGARLCVSGALLLALLLSLNTWTGLAYASQAVYWPTLAGFALLLWLWALTFELDARLLAAATRSTAWRPSWPPLRAAWRPGDSRRSAVRTQTSR